MFTKEQLQGILLSFPKAEITIQKNDDRLVGYSVRLGIHFRCKNRDFLFWIQRTLLQYEINSLMVSRESNARPHPRLSISGFDSMVKLVDLIPEIGNSNADAHGQWGVFSEVAEIMQERLHLTHEGIEQIINLKEQIL